MSDAGRKMDVEDVLSSIRRLVSEEARKTGGESSSGRSSKVPADAENTLQQDNPPAPGKLVLTSAFRVPDQARAAPDTSEIEKRISDIETLVLRETKAHSDRSRMDADAASTTDYSGSEGEDAMTGGAHVEPENEHAEAATEQFPKNAEPEEEKAEDATEEPPSVLEALSLTSADLATPANDPQPAPEAEIAAPSPDTDVEPDPEPEIPETGAPVESFIHRPEPETETEPDYGDDAVDFTAGTDTYLDEEALRELVSEMVRSELQGELGDRITRNVRKLVRREIQRAITSREFD